MAAQVNRWCSLTRLMGQRRIMRLETYYSYTNSHYINTITAAAISTASHLKNSSYSFDSFGSQPYVGRGLEYKWIANPRCKYYHSEESKGGGECDLKKEKSITIGDFVNLSELLFTKNRDYLVRYNDPELVTAEQLAGKLIVLYFVPLHSNPNPYFYEKLFRKSLMDTYNDLKFKNCFEVVMVVVDDVSGFDGELGQLCFDPSLQGKFEDIFSKCPSWAAIPFSDITSRKRLKSRFGHFGRLFDHEMVLIDTKGMVFNTFPQNLFQTYGSEAYPFTDDQIAFVNSKDKTAFSKHSLKELLGSSERDFVISNKGEEVPVHSLEDKVVALYFYEDGFSPDFLTRKLKMYYGELKKKNQNFEVVLLYLYDTQQTMHSTKEKFQKTFETMPWLALPYKDPVHKKLKRLFGYPDERYHYIDGPRLVIVGPGRNIIGCRDIIASGAATIMRGYDGNLFMREEFAKEEEGEVKLEMLCSSNTVFKRKDGSQVQFSQLAGKRIIFLFEGDFPEYDGLGFLEDLKSAYMRAKGIAGEFEVIYFPNNKDEDGKRVADMPWLISCAVKLLPGCSAYLSFYGNSYNRYHSSLLLAFGRDGSLLRRSICPYFGDDHFPFYAEGLDAVNNVKTDAFDIDRSDFCWGYWDTLYQGLLRDSRYNINFPSADHLFGVYYY